MSCVRMEVYWESVTKQKMSRDWNNGVFVLFRLSCHLSTEVAKAVERFPFRLAGNVDDFLDEAAASN